jgi:hypothetical protein
MVEDLSSKLNLPLIISIVAALAAVASACFTHSHSTLARKALALAHQGLVLDRRAWVGPTELKHVVEVGKQLRIEVDIKNGGATPALNVKADINLRIVPATEQFVPDFAPIRYEPSLFTLQPGASFQLVRFTPEARTADDLQAYEQGTKKVYWFGWITYLDVFKQPHKTTFCFVLRQDLNGGTLCPIHNEAD